MRTKQKYTLHDFLRVCVKSTHIAMNAGTNLYLSRLLPVHALTAGAIANNVTWSNAPLVGFWAFVHDKKRTVGIAELRITKYAIVFTGINTGRIARRAAQAVKTAERHAARNVRFIRSTMLFYTALAFDGRDSTTILPVIGSNTAAERTRQRKAEERLDKHRAARRNQRGTQRTVAVDNTARRARATKLRRALNS